MGLIPLTPEKYSKMKSSTEKFSQRKLAENIVMSHTVLNEILNGRRSLTTTTAFLFEEALGVPAALLLRIQLRYDMQMAKSGKKLIDWILSEKTAVLWPETLPYNESDVPALRSYLS